MTSTRGCIDKTIIGQFISHYNVYPSIYNVISYRKYDLPFSIEANKA